MDDECKPDMTCVPYRRFPLYALLTVPMVCMIGFAAYVLWLDSYIFTIIYIGLFILTNFFQSYCCHYQSCPYVGGFCPAVAGIIPSSFIAKIWEKLNIKKSKIWFEIFATCGSLTLFSLIVFPLYWLFLYHIVAFVGFLLMVIIYAATFLLTICPVCAVRKSCPGGKASTKLRRADEKESV